MNKWTAPPEKVLIAFYNPGENSLNFPMFSPYGSQPSKKANNTLCPHPLQHNVGREEAQITNPVSQHYLGEREP